MKTGTPQAKRSSTSAEQAGRDSSLSASFAVEALGLTKLFGMNRAVDAVDLTVMRGEIFGVLGPNGAGKTTMLNMLATLLPIDGGEARIFGYDVRSEGHAVRQLIGVTGQFASVDENLTGRENLWMFGRLQDCPQRRPTASATTCSRSSTSPRPLTARSRSSPVGCGAALTWLPA